MNKEKYGFVYIWRDRKHNRYYVGCHWGTEDDGYVCSSNWMRDAFRRRPEDFKRRILQRGLSRENMYVEEQRYFSMIKPSEIKVRYYNLCLSAKNLWHKNSNTESIGAKISKAKTGKKIGCTSERAAAISAGKKAAFAKRQEELGYKVSPETRRNLGKNALGLKHTEEWKKQASIRTKEQWKTGVRTPWQHK